MKMTKGRIAGNLADGSAELVVFVDLPVDQHAIGFERCFPVRFHFTSFCSIVFYFFKRLLDEAVGSWKPLYQVCLFDVVHRNVQVFVFGQSFVSGKLPVYN